MLTAIRRADHEKVLARDSEKDEAPFVCPRCLGDLILRKGRIKVHHFSHRPPVTCALGRGETEQHLRAKLAIFDALKAESNVSELELEKDFGVSVADVFAVIAGSKVAIEIQRSALSVNEIVDRTLNYARLGVAVLWVGLPNPDLNTAQYSPRAWEKWVHAAFFGRIYIWVEGQAFDVYHLDKYHIYVEATSWHSSGGEEHSGGGYERVSRRWRTPMKLRRALLASDFSPRRRAAWSGGTVSVPACILYVDRDR